jgi:hypothetical protein
VIGTPGGLVVPNEANPSEFSIVPHDHIVFTDLDGTEGVLVDLNAKSFYRLNETAMLVWQGLEQRRRIDEIINEITLRYEVPVEHAAASVEGLVRSFKTYKLVR